MLDGWGHARVPPLPELLCLEMVGIIILNFPSRSQFGISRQVSCDNALGNYILATPIDIHRYLSVIGE